METFGYPPQFPSAAQEAAAASAAAATAAAASAEQDIIPKDKSKGKKSKAVAKTGAAKYQWQIMQSLGLADEDIKKFADPAHWLEYFPPLAKQDLTELGMHVSGGGSNRINSPTNLTCAIETNHRSTGAARSSRPTRIRSSTRLCAGNSTT